MKLLLLMIPLYIYLLFVLTAVTVSGTYDDKIKFPIKRSTVAPQSDQIHMERGKGGKKGGLNVDY